MIRCFSWINRSDKVWETGCPTGQCLRSTSVSHSTRTLGWCWRPRKSAVIETWQWEDFPPFTDDFPWGFPIATFDFTMLPKEFTNSDPIKTRVFGATVTKLIDVLCRLTQYAGSAQWRFSCCFVTVTSRSSESTLVNCFLFNMNLKVNIHQFSHCLNPKFKKRVKLPL